MPASYKIDFERSRIRAEFYEEQTAASFRALLEALIADPQVSPGMDMLTEHTRVTAFATAEMIFAMLPLLDQLAKRVGHLRIAMIAPRKVQFGMANLLSTHVGLRQIDMEIRPFRDPVAAEAWLDAKR